MVENECLLDAVAKVITTSGMCQSSLVATERRAFLNVRKNPSDTSSRRLLTAVKLKRGDYLSALRVIKNNDPKERNATFTGHVDVGDSTTQQLTGFAYALTDQPELARQEFSSAVKSSPCDWINWVMLGRIHERSGQHQHAMECYRRASLVEDPQHRGVLCLSRLLLRRRKWQAAMVALRQAIARDKRSPTLNLQLARVLERLAGVMRKQGRLMRRDRLLQEAAERYRIAVAGAPSVDAYVSLGVIERRLEQHTQAKESFKKSLEISPKHVGALTQLAASDLDAGEFKRGSERLQEVLRLDPSRAIAHFRFSRAKKFQPGDEANDYMGELSGLLQRTDLPRYDEIHLSFAHAKVLDDVGQPDLAWEHYSRANRLKLVEKKIEGESGRVALRQRLGNQREMYEQFFTGDRFESLAAVGNPSEVPVFIVGMPRSGTTLVEQILSSHSDVAGAGELHDIEQISRQLRRSVRGVRSQGVRDLSLKRGGLQRRTGQGIPQKKSRASNTVRSDSGQVDMSQYPELLMAIPADQFESLANRYLARLEKDRANGQRRVCDKMPTNFWHLGLIGLLFPNATVIHCRRNPLDVFVSSFCQNLSYPFCDLESLEIYYQEYLQVMNHWESVLPNSILTVDYETLVSDPESTSKRMVEHCGLDWSEQCLRHHENRRVVQTPSKWQVRQPIYRTSVERWRRFERHLTNLSVFGGCSAANGRDQETSIV